MIIESAIVAESVNAAAEHAIAHAGVGYEDSELVFELSGPPTELHSGT